MSPIRDARTLVQDFFAAVRARDWARVLRLAGPANAVWARDTLIAKMAMRRALAEAQSTSPGDMAIGYLGAPPVAALVTRYGHLPVSAFHGRPTLRELATRPPEGVLVEHFRLLSQEPELEMDLPIRIFDRTPQDEVHACIRVSHLVPDDDEPDADIIPYRSEGEPLSLTAQTGELLLGIPSCLLRLPQTVDEEWRTVAV